jgi:hypothetical protein
MWDLIKLHELINPTEILESARKCLLIGERYRHNKVADVGNLMWPFTV